MRAVYLWKTSVPVHIHMKDVRSGRFTKVLLLMRKRIKSLLKRLKNIGMASEKLYQNTLTANLIKVKSRSKNVCIFC